MMNKKTKSLFVIIGFLTLLTCAGIIFAQTDDGTLEVQYPNFGGADSPNSTGYLLTSYIRYIYRFAIISGGLIALMSLIYGGFRFLTSAGKPAAITDARGQILAGLLGLVVILGSYIILNELNPDLITLRMPGAQIAGRKGIILYSAANCAGLGDAASAPEISDSDSLRGVFYKSMSSSGSAILGKENDNNVLPVSFYSFHEQRELTLELYTNEKCEGDPAAALTNLQQNTCQELGVSNVQCIRFVWYTSGIWVFNTLNNGDAPDPMNLPDWFEEGRQYMVYKSNQDALPFNFTDQIVAIAIVPDETLERNFGVITHNISGPILKEKGWAHIYLPECGNTENCNMNGNITRYRIEGGARGISSLTIFNVPKTGDNFPAGEIKICRNDRCEIQRVEENGTNVDHDASIIYFPGVGLTETTGTFGGFTIYNAGSGVIYGINLEDEEWWDGGNHVALGRNVADGVSAIEINEKANYLVLLYEHHFDDFADINKNNGVDAAIINVSMPSLRTISMDGRVGTIIVINVSPGENY